MKLDVCAVPQCVHALRGGGHNWQVILGKPFEGSRIAMMYILRITAVSM